MFCEGMLLVFGSVFEAPLYIDGVPIEAPTND